MNESIFDIPVRTIEGRDGTLADHGGAALLIVNVASKCGYTPQYEGLQALQERYGSRGFAVLGFPANDFANQEPGSDEEIRGFCSTNFGVTFPLFSKITVTGADKHPLYRHLTAACPQTHGRDEIETTLRSYDIEPLAAPEVAWNFEKFLIARDGSVAGRFASSVAPDDPAITAAIESELERN